MKGVTLKRNPIALVRNFIFVEVGGYLTFVLLGALANYGEIYNELPLGHVFSYHLAETTFIFLAELVITLFLFFNWFYTYYRITPESVVYARGVLVHKKTTLLLKDIDWVGHSYSLFGKLFRYGTLEVREAASQKYVRFKFVSAPERYAALIMKFKKTGKVQAPLERPVTPSNPSEFLGKEESEHLEFKSTLRWDLRQAKVNRQLEKTAMKTIAAFLNSNGGHLVIGVGDGSAREVVGLHHDYASLPRADQDGFQNHFTQLVNAAIGPEFRQFLSLQFAKIEDKEVCVVAVAPATKPAFVRFDNNEEFYVRTGNSSTPLRVSEAATYLDLWRRRKG
jgi:hypothetical protein